LCLSYEFAYFLASFLIFESDSYTRKGSKQLAELFKHSLLFLASAS
jgi:hypothetical protein